jgi:hypothetical protein
VADQPGKAAFAAATALSTSSTVQQGASAITFPVLEFVTGMYFVVDDSRHSLFTQYLNRFASIIVFSLINSPVIVDGKDLSHHANK